MVITHRHRRILRHALGIKYGAKSYRNHYCAPFGSENYEACEELTEEGYMTCRQLEGEDEGDHTYFITDKGKEYINSVGAKNED